jgi:4-oxalocrotonate tautomerase
MPFVRISVSSEVSQQQLTDISDAVHDSMVSTFNVPRKDRFQVLTRHAAHELTYPPEYLDVVHSARIALIQITCNEGRTLEMKKALFALIASSVEATGAVKSSDVIINLVEVKKENWSFGNGIAQYAI